MFVCIQINSKNRNSLNFFIKLLFKLCNFYRLNVLTFMKIFNKKSQHRILSILQSPHVNKTSQEQFEYRLTSKQLNIKSCQIFKLLKIIKNLKDVVGTNIAIKLLYITVKNMSKKYKHLFFKKYYMQSFRDKKLTKNYLKLIDYCAYFIL